MAAEVQPLAPLKLPSEPSALTEDQKYWKSFTNQVLLPSSNSSPITYISSNTTSRTDASSSLTPVSNYITITTGPRLQLLSPQTLKASKTITRTTSPFHSAHVRRDGRICISGSDSGVIQAFDINSRAILKTWHEHKQPVWVAKWHPTDLTGAMSCSDDRTVRLWDLPSDQSVWTGHGHQDYVRAGTFIGDGKLIASGSYDQTIRVWDPRVGNGSDSVRNTTVMKFKLPAPVESVVALPGGTTLVASAGEKLAVLDLIAGRPLGLFSNHQKTITSIATASQGSRVLSGGLDGHVKVWDTASWNVVAGIQYKSPVLSLDVVAAGPHREDRHLCVGMQSGVLSIRTRLTGAAKAAKKEKEREMAALVAGKIDEYDARQKKKRGRGWEKTLRGMDFTGEGADIIIEGSDRRRLKLNKWENAQRRGDYQEALDLVIQSDDMAAIYTMLTEMYHRSALKKALSNRNAEQLLPVLNWLNKSIGDPKFTRLKADVAMQILDIYGAQMGKSEAVDAAIEKLLGRTKAACEASQMCWTAMGMLDLLKMDAVK